MADMNVQIKFQSDIKGALSGIKTISDSLLLIGDDAKNAEEALQGLDESVTGADDSTNSLSDTSESLRDRISDLSDAFIEAAKNALDLSNAEERLRDIGEGLDRLEKSAKKFGMEFSKNVTAPIAGIAAISLKNLYDIGALEGSVGPARSFALAIQDLVKNFKDLTVEIGTMILPYAKQVIGIFNTAIQTFRNLSSETKQTIIQYAALASAIGPVVLAFSTFLSIALKLAPVFSALSGAFMTIARIVAGPAGLFVSLVGIVNVMGSLRKAGVGTAEALLMSFNLFVTGFNNYVTKNLLKGINTILQGMSSLAGIFSDSLATGINSASEFVSGFVDKIETQFAQSKGDVDSVLQSIGSSAADAFTFGMASKVSGIADTIADGLSNAAKNVAENGQLQSEIEAQLKAYRSAEQEYANIQKSIREETAASARSMAEGIAGGMTDALSDFATGAKDAGTAFADFAKSTITNMLKMITQATLMNALFPPGSAMGNLLTGFASAARYAQGGLVVGPGTGTSDSIPAWLSNGEFVADAKTVKHFGVDFFKNLQTMAKGGVPITGKSNVARFADGGMVTSASSAPQVVIENKGGEKSVVGSSYDPKTAVITVMLEDFNRNGPVSKQIQSTFGVRRGGLT